MQGSSVSPEAGGGYGALKTPPLCFSLPCLLQPMCSQGWADKTQTVAEGEPLKPGAVEHPGGSCPVFLWWVQDGSEPGRAAGAKKNFCCVTDGVSDDIIEAVGAGVGYGP